LYHHPLEDLVFAKLKLRDPAAAAKVGNLTLEHQKGAERLRRVAQAVDGVLADRKILRQDVDSIVRDFIESERRHFMMEDRKFFPAALKALEHQDWTEIASASTSHEDPGQFRSMRCRRREERLCYHCASTKGFSPNHGAH
jgi:hemerythrin-like domain-containing protein